MIELADSVVAAYAGVLTWLAASSITTFRANRERASTVVSALVAAVGLAALVIKAVSWLQ